MGKWHLTGIPAKELEDRLEALEAVVFRRKVPKDSAAEPEKTA